MHEHAANLKLERPLPKNFGFLYYGLMCCVPWPPFPRWLQDRVIPRGWHTKNPSLVPRSSTCGHAQSWVPKGGGGFPRVLRMSAPWVLRLLVFQSSFIIRPSSRTQCYKYNLWYFKLQTRLGVVAGWGSLARRGGPGGSFRRPRLLFYHGEMVLTEVRFAAVVVGGSVSY
jgi:hypothetical protein